MKKMKKKIYIYLSIIATLAIILSSSLLVLIFYNFHMDKTKDGFLSVFLTILPALLLVFFLILFISLALSSFLSAKILKPIDNMAENMESLLVKNELDTLDIYDELLPFVKTLVKQSHRINLQLKDITEKAEIMDTIMSSMNEGLVLVDNEKHILSINTSSIGLLNGNTKLNYISKSFITLCRDLEINHVIDKVLNNHQSQELIFQLGDRYIYLLVNPVFINKESYGAVILIVDYTEKYKVDLIRKEFSANVSHELKTPLTSINGYAEMIESGMAQGTDIIKFASIIKKEGTRLLGLIDSIIRLSKIEYDKIPEEFVSLDIYSIGENILNNLKFLAREKNIELNIIGNKTMVKANKSMMEELIYNLLDNAIKYTNEGGFVTLEINKDSSNTFIKVKDTGIGIPLEHQDRIFERFYVVDKSRTKKSQSTGLGLSIVKHIVEYHNGTIDLSSPANSGTEIIVTIRKD